MFTCSHHFEVPIIIRWVGQIKQRAIEVEGGIKIKILPFVTFLCDIFSGAAEMKYLLAGAFESRPERSREGLQVNQFR